MTELIIKTCLHGNRLSWLSGYPTHKSCSAIKSVLGHACFRSLGLVTIRLLQLLHATRPLASCPVATRVGIIRRRSLTTLSYQVDHMTPLPSLTRTVPIRLRNKPKIAL